MARLQIVLKQFGDSLKQFAVVLKVKKNMLVRDSAIKRFEITLDLSWKAAKVYLNEKKGEDCNFPKDCIRKAFQAGLIDYNDAWLKFVDNRNTAAHTYNESFANDLYKRLPKALKLFQELLDNLKK